MLEKDVDDTALPLILKTQFNHIAHLETEIAGLRGEIRVEMDRRSSGSKVISQERLQQRRGRIVKGHPRTVPAKAAAGAARCYSEPGKPHDMNAEFTVLIEHGRRQLPRWAGPVWDCVITSTTIGDSRPRAH